MGFNFLPLMNVIIDDSKRQAIIARNVPTDIQANIEDLTSVLVAASNRNVKTRAEILAKEIQVNRNAICYGYEPEMEILPDVELVIVHAPLQVFKKVMTKMVALPRTVAFANNNVVEKAEAIVVEMVPQPIETVNPSNIRYMEDWRPKLRNVS
jgi:hypothetical protein